MRLLLAAALMLLVASPAAAITIASHDGANDPTSEGWTFNNDGDAMGTAGPVFDDGLSMLDAWSTDDDGTNSNLSYSQDLTSDLPTLAAGWTYEVLLRVADVPDPLDFGVSAQVENGARGYAMTFGTNATGDVLVSLSGLGQVAVVPNGSADYHLFEFVEADTGTSVLEFRIDGVAVVDYVGIVSNRALVAFGDTSVTPGSGGQGNYAQVTLTAVPEPGSGVLLLASLGILAARRRRRSDRI